MGSWPDRQRAWQRRLRRIRLGAEPVEEQVERLRRVTWGLTIVAAGIGLLFFALFAAFREPLIGLVFGGGLTGPIIALAWWSFVRTRRAAVAYLRERDDFASSRTPVGSEENGSGPGGSPRAQ